MLASAISDAVADMDPANAKFGLASGKTNDEYRELQFSKNVPVRFGQSMLLVLRDAAEAAQTQGQTESGGSAGTPTAGGTTTAGGGALAGVSRQSARPKRFSGVIELDTIRGAMKVSQIFESVIAELDRAEGATFRIVLEVQAESGAGFPKEVEDDVTANADALGFLRKQFE